MQIPIENIYYLLSYAWDKLDEKDRVQVATDGKAELVDLLALVLLNGTRILLKRGLEHSYRATTEEVHGVKGKLELAQTLKSNLLQKQRTFCTVDEYSADVKINQIVVTTLVRLLKTEQLDKNVKQEIRKVLPMFPPISHIKLTSYCFRQIRYHSNNRFYQFLIHICELVFENLLPAERPGTFHFTDFRKDEQQMNRLFEAFIFNFYRHRQKKFSVRREQIRWQFQSSAEDYSYLPLMQTDITLENAEDKVIIV